MKLAFVRREGADFMVRPYETDAKEHFGVAAWMCVAPENLLETVRGLLEMEPPKPTEGGVTPLKKEQT